MSQLYANVLNFNIYKITDITIPTENWGMVYDTVIDEFMNDKVKEVLGIIPDDKMWSFVYDDAYNAQYESYHALEPAWPVVDEILKTSNVDVIVYSGQLDAICNTAGTLRWIQRLTWPGLEEYNQAERKIVANPHNHEPEMFVKSYDHLKMYWILNAGHVVPVDVPNAALRMLNRILDDSD